MKSFRGSRPTRPLPSSRLSTKRGFAILLYSYLGAFFSVVSLTVLLTSGSLELRQAERTLAMSRAFWGAEGGLEQGIAWLRTGELPELEVGQCSPFTSLTLGDTQGSYRLCLDRVEPMVNWVERRRYRIEGAGTTPGATQALSTLVDYSANVIQFRHLSYADNVFLSNTTTGGRDTDLLSQLATTPFHGDVVTPRTTPAHRDSNGDGILEPWPRIVVKNRSKIHGDIAVGPSADLSTLVTMTVDSTLTGEKKSLAPGDMPPMHPIIVPSNATPLKNVVKMDEASGELLQSACLVPGVYVTKFLAITENHQLCTTGPVELYITGGEGGSPPQHEIRGKLYGQPLGSEPFDEDYSPKDLRIFNMGTGKVTWLNTKARSLLLSGVVYAPEADLAMATTGPFTFIGSLITRNLVLDNKGGRMKLFYDDTLANRKIRVGPADVQVKLWMQ